MQKREEKGKKGWGQKGRGNGGKGKGGKRKGRRRALGSNPETKNLGYVAVNA